MIEIETKRIVVAGGELNAACTNFLSKIVNEPEPRTKKSLSWVTERVDRDGYMMVFIRRPSDAPVSINDLSGIQVGLSNTDSWKERGWSGETMPIKDTTLGNARISLAVPYSDYMERADFDGLISIIDSFRGGCIATEFPNLLREVLERFNIPNVAVLETELRFDMARIQREKLVGIVKTSGKTEVMPQLYPGLIVAIGDVVASGESLRANGLVEVTTLENTRLELGWKGEDKLVGQLLQAIDSRSVNERK